MQQEPRLPSIADHLSAENAGDSDVYYSAVTATE